jgi:hypothetical protein
MRFARDGQFLAKGDQRPGAARPGPPFFPPDGSRQSKQIGGDGVRRGARLFVRQDRGDIVDPYQSLAVAGRKRQRRDAECDGGRLKPTETRKCPSRVPAA